MAHYNIYQAIRETRLFLSYLPESIGDSARFNLGWCTLTIHQYNIDQYEVRMLGIPTRDNHLHLTRQEYIDIALDNE